MSHFDAVNRYYACNRSFLCACEQSRNRAWYCCSERQKLIHFEWVLSTQWPFCGLRLLSCWADVVPEISECSQFILTLSDRISLIFECVNNDDSDVSYLRKNGRERRIIENDLSLNRTLTQKFESAAMTNSNLLEVITMIRVINGQLDAFVC